jgi:hypothetical protein
MPEGIVILSTFLLYLYVSSAIQEACISWLGHPFPVEPTVIHVGVERFVEN